MNQYNKISYINNTSDIIYSKFVKLVEQIGELLPDSLSVRLNIENYAQKLLNNAFIYIAKKEEEYIGLIAFYANDPANKSSYLSLLGVCKEFQGNGIADVLLNLMISYLHDKGYIQSNLEVSKNNSKALSLYRKYGYKIIESNNEKYNMSSLIKFARVLPSPLQKIEIKAFKELESIELWIKDDYLYEYPFGGNKARKAIYFLNYALKNNITHIVTNGGINSNHVRAIAIGCAIYGIKCHLIIHNDEFEIKRNPNIELLKMLNATLVLCKTCEIGHFMEIEIEKIRNIGGKPLYIWGGGHSPLGTMAYKEAFEEYKAQEIGKQSDYIFLASGTGTTQAGLIVGNTNEKTKIVGISVARENPRGISIINHAIKEFYDYYKMEYIEKYIEFLDAYNAGGYEKTNEKIDDVVKKAATNGLILDPTYTGKAFWGLIESLKSGKINEGAKVLFWHTGGILNFYNYINS